MTHCPYLTISVSKFSVFCAPASTGWLWTATAPGVAMNSAAETGD
jgi:hypothetical protein